MAIDFKWMSQGGVLLDGGDLALCDPLEGLKDMVRTRLKAALHAWKLYAIGADLEDFIGNAITPELEVSLRRQVVNALQKDLLPRGSFQVKTLATGQHIAVMVYISSQLTATATISQADGSIVVNTVS
jgi:hypothetical protein